MVKAKIGCSPWDRNTTLTVDAYDGDAVLSCIHDRNEVLAILDLASSDIYSGPWLDAEDCCDFGALLVRIGEAMKAGATAEEALVAVAGEGE